MRMSFALLANCMWISLATAEPVRSDFVRPEAVAFAMPIDTIEPELSITEKDPLLEGESMPYHPRVPIGSDVTIAESEPLFLSLDTTQHEEDTYLDIIMYPTGIDTDPIFGTEFPTSIDGQPRAIGENYRDVIDVQILQSTNTASPIQTPEPSVLALVAIGTAGLAVRRRFA